MKAGEIHPKKLGPQVMRIELSELKAFVARLKAEQYGSPPAPGAPRRESAA